MLVNNQTRVQHVPLFIAAGKNVIVLTSNPNRNYLKITVQGPNSIRYRFDAPADAVNGIQLGGGSDAEWPDEVPGQSLNISSLLGTHVVIIEGGLPNQ